VCLRDGKRWAHGGTFGIGQAFWESAGAAWHGKIVIIQQLWSRCEKLWRALLTPLPRLNELSPLFDGFG
jgi:hypothetical protein